MKIVLADDAALIREGLAGLLARQGHEILAEAASADELEAVVARYSEEVEVVITDVRMPPQMSDDGLRAAVKIRAAHPQIGLLVLSQYVAPAYARELFTHEGPSFGLPGTGGGTGYLLKDRVARVADFLKSLDIIAAGGTVVDPEVATALMNSRSSTLDELTAREREVLELMARGLSNGQIQAELVLSPAAVSKHVANVFLKLGLGPEEENRRVRAVLRYLTETA